MVRDVVAGNDQYDSLSNETVYNPCLPNPCQNGGLCTIGFGNVFACYCPHSFTGLNKI